MTDFQVLTARPRGFCRGVENAIEIVEHAIDLVGTPLYVKHAIVHNRAVIDDFEQRGVIFIEEIEEIPEGSVAVFSAHGSPPSDYEKARERNIDVVDATCKLVTNVHNWAGRFAQKGYTVIVLGHRDHPEPRGILGNIDHGDAHLIETVEEAEALDVRDPEHVACVTQTTLSVDDVRNVREVLKRRFPELKEPPTKNSTICYATDNRQAAVKQLAEASDLVLVVGSSESSNTNRLREVAEQYGAIAHRIDYAAEVRSEWLDGVRTVGVTSGASAPERLVQAVLDRLSELGAGAIQELQAVDENVGPFTLPERLIELAREQGREIERQTT